MPCSTTTTYRNWQFPSNLSLCNKSTNRLACRYSTSNALIMDYKGSDEPSLNIIIIIITSNHKMPIIRKKPQIQMKSWFPSLPNPKHHQLGLLNIVVEMATKISTYVIQLILWVMIIIFETGTDLWAQVGQNLLTSYVSAQVNTVT